MFVQRIGSLTTGKVSQNSNQSTPKVAFASKSVRVPDEFVKGAEGKLARVVKENPKETWLDWLLSGIQESDPTNPENVHYPRSFK